MSIQDKIEFLIQNGSILDTVGIIYLYHPKISEKVFFLTKKQYEGKEFEKSREVNVDSITPKESRHDMRILIAKTKNAFDV